MHVERGSEKAIWSHCVHDPERVDAVCTLLLDAALHKCPLPRQVASVFQHPDTVAHVRLFVGGADTRHVVAGAAISTRERSDSAATRAASSVCRSDLAAAISCV